MPRARTALCRNSSPYGFPGSQGSLHFARRVMVAVSRRTEAGQKLLDLIYDISRDLVPIAEAAE